MKKFISYFLIVFGLILILSPFLKNMIVKNINQKASENLLLEDIKINNQKNDDIEFDFDAVKDVDIQMALRGAFNYDQSKVGGILFIPDLDMKLPIMKGLSDDSLLAGAGTMKKNQKLGEGNFSLAGHNMKDSSLLFGSLMDIKDGPKIYASDGENIYEYLVYKTEIVKDDRIDMIEDEKAVEKGMPIISLMTCYQTSKTGKRFFAVGELVDVYPVENNTIDIK